MEQWIIVVIIVVSLIAVYVISGLIVGQLTKRAENKVYDEMAKIAPYEKERLELIKKVASALKERNYGFPKQFSELIDETDEIMNTRPIDIAKAKGNDDFLLIYFQKYLTEKRLTSQTIFADYLNEIKNHLCLDNKVKDNPYSQYNKVASHYNAFHGLILFSPFIKRKNRESAPFL